MSESVVTHRVALAALPIEAPRAWRDGLLRRSRAGARLLTLYGQRRGDEVTITAALRGAAGPVDVTRTRVSAEFGYHNLTEELPSAHCFERELHEQTGVRIAGHPWPKPLRHGGSTRSPLEAYPYYQLEGKEVHEVAVGPIHAGVIEPGSFRFQCLGERVHHLEIQLGYQHRGVESLLRRGDPRRLGPLVETIAGDSSVAHAWAYCAALERLADSPVEVEAGVARAVALELERIAMHLSGLAGMAADIGFLQGATTYGRLRTTAINSTMLLCGSRFGRSAVRPGGIGMRLLPEQRRELWAALDLLRRDLAVINDCFLAASTVQHRLRGIGTLTRALAAELGVVGLAARASGVAIDARHETTTGAYRLVPLPMTVVEEGDCWARAKLRIGEIDASVQWLQLALALYNHWDRPRRSVAALAPSQLALAIVEGWRGEVVHALETNEAGELAHYKVQDPSLRNWIALTLAVRGGEISDFPICNKSFDLSYCGSDL